MKKQKSQVSCPFKLLIFLTFIIWENWKLSFCAEYVFMEKQYWIFLHTFDLWKHVAVHIDKSKIELQINIEATHFEGQQQHGVVEWEKVQQGVRQGLRQGDHDMVMI